MGLYYTVIGTYILQQQTLDLCITVRTQAARLAHVHVHRAVEVSMFGDGISAGVEDASLENLCAGAVSDAHPLVGGDTGDGQRDGTKRKRGRDVLDCVGQADDQGHTAENRSRAKRGEAGEKEEEDERG